MDNMLYHINAQRLRPGSGASLDILNAAEARRARRFHAGFAQYATTTLVPQPYQASTHGLANIPAQDEATAAPTTSPTVAGSMPAKCLALPMRWAVTLRNGSENPLTI